MPKMPRSIRYTFFLLIPPHLVQNYLAVCVVKCQICLTVYWAVHFISYVKMAILFLLNVVYILLEFQNARTIHLFVAWKNASHCLEAALANAMKELEKCRLTIDDFGDMDACIEKSKLLVEAHDFLDTQLKKIKSI